MNQGHNGAPFHVLELTEYEHECLVKLFKRGSEQAEETFKDLCNMPSTDERARFRSLLTAGAMGDKVLYDQLLEKMETEQ